MTVIDGRNLLDGLHQGQGRKLTAWHGVHASCRPVVRVANRQVWAPAVVHFRELGTDGENHGNRNA